MNARNAMLNFYDKGANKYGEFYKLRGPWIMESQVFIHLRVGDDLVQSERLTKLDPRVLIGALTNVVIRPAINHLNSIYEARKATWYGREFVIYFESDSCTMRNAGLAALQKYWKRLELGAISIVP